MFQLGGTIKEALERIAKNKYVLPAIQREFVWRQEQICRLFDSVMQGYPFGEFLFWNIEADKSADYRYYEFVRDYHQRDNPHCPEHRPISKQQMTAVLDGQQRLTAFNIGLRGSMAAKLPRKWWKSPDAFPSRILALNLLSSKEQDEEGNRYIFAFVNKRKIGRDGEKLWFDVSHILNMNAGPDMLAWLVKFDLNEEQQLEAFSVLDRLYRAIHTEKTIAYYEINNQDIEYVLAIFIRRNSGGTTLSYSDLLLSIATSQWERLDARKEVHKLVDDLNGIGSLGLSKDFVLKSGLMLTDISSVGFKVRNFTRDNMKKIESNWQGIRNALVRTVELISSFGFDAKSIRAISALLPIAYYLYRIGAPENFHSLQKYANDRNVIRNWLIRSILKASGIWGSGLDTLLTGLRKEIQGADEGQFPAKELKRLMVRRGKSLEFAEEEIEDMADMELKDPRVFALLSLLSPHVNIQYHNFHIDHVFPKSRFTESRLRKLEINDDQLKKFADCANRIANFQLLEGAVNQEKRDNLPAEWIESFYPNEKQRQSYCDQHHLGDFKEIPCDMTGFLDFYNTRRDRLKGQIDELVKFL